MWKMIIGQAIFQLTVTLIMHFVKAPGFLDYEDEVRRSVVFNTFVWMQIFNEFNNRRLDNKFNVLTGLHRNWFFIGINIIMVGAQAVIANYGGVAFSIVPINGVQWAICIVVAAFSLPWAMVIRTFPDPWFAAIAHVVGKPFVVVYHPLSRGMHSLWRPFGSGFRRLGQMMKFKRKDESENESDASDVEKGTSTRHTKD
jgi:Ca2+-transporting ATPase